MCQYVIFFALRKDQQEVYFAYRLARIILLINPDMDWLRDIQAAYNKVFWRNKMLHLYSGAFRSKDSE